MSGKHPESGGRRDDNGERIQRIHTPIEIWRRLDRFWPDGVAFDPCGSPDSLGKPATTCYPEHPNPLMRDGLIVSWQERTFWNPPWGELKTWLAKGAESTHSIALIPVRTRRHWWRAFMRKSDAHVMLDAITFAGEQHAYPGDVAIVLRHPHPLEVWPHFLEVWGDLGGAHLGGLSYNDPRDAQASLF